MNSIASLIQARPNGSSIPNHMRKAPARMQPAKHNSESFFQEHVNRIFALFYTSVVLIGTTGTLVIYLWAR